MGQSSWPFERYHVPWKDILKISAPVAASESCEWVQFGIDVSIPHPKWQVKPLKSLFHFYQQNKSFESKVEFRQPIYHCKRVLKDAKLTYMIIKQKSSSLPRNLALRTFGILLIVFSKVNLLYLLYSTGQRYCLLHVIKQNCLLKTFFTTLPWWLGISLNVFPSRTNLKLVKKVITNLDSSKTSGPSYIPVVVLKYCESEHPWVAINF